MGGARFDLHWIDYTIVVVYFVGVSAHGLWVSRGKESSEDYFLAGGSLPWWLIGFSLYASNMSGSSFVGLVGGAYDNGLVIFNYEWTAAVVLIFFLLCILPSFLRAKIYTVPEFLEKRYDWRARRAFSVFSLLAIMFIDTAGALYAGGLVIANLSPYFQLWSAVALLAAVAGLYTIFGGLGAVVVTDTVQAILLMIGGVLAVVFSALGQREDPERVSRIDWNAEDMTSLLGGLSRPAIGDVKILSGVLIVLIGGAVAWF